jgi:hypothetical protein
LGDVEQLAWEASVARTGEFANPNPIPGQVIHDGWEPQDRFSKYAVRNARRR